MHKTAYYLSLGSLYTKASTVLFKSEMLGIYHLNFSPPNWAYHNIKQTKNIFGIKGKIFSIYN